MFLPVFIAAAQETPPAPGAPRSAVVPQPVERTLANGLRVIVVNRQNVPLVTAQLVVKSGGEADQENLGGTADFAAELLTKGTKKRTAPQIAEEIDFLGGSLVSNANWDASTVTVGVLSDKLDKALEIAADTVVNPAFQNEEIERYRTQLLDELNVSLTQPGTLAAYVASRVALGSSSYAHPLSGTPESVRALKRDNLIHFHRMHYRPDNAILIFVGDVAPDAAFALANKHFGKWKKAKKMIDSSSDMTRSSSSGPVINDLTISREPRNKLPSKITIVDFPNAGQAAVYAVLGINSFSSRNADYFPALVANSVLGGGYSARLNQEIRIKRGLSYGANSRLSVRSSEGYFQAGTQTRNETAAEVAEIMSLELARLAAGELPESELVPRKAVITGDFGRDLETNNGLVEQLAERALYYIPLGEINNFVANVQKVRAEDVRSFASADLPISNTNIIIVGDSGKFLPDLKKRFGATPVEVIPFAELDLNNATLRKPKTTETGAPKL